MEQGVTIRYGAMCDTLKDQLTEQHLKFEEAKIEHFQRCLDGFLLLRIGGFIPDAEGDKIIKRFQKKLMAYINKQN